MFGWLMSVLESYLEPFPFLCVSCPLYKNPMVYNLPMWFIQTSMALCPAASISVSREVVRGAHSWALA